MFYVHPYLGKIPILTIIFFKWVVQPPTSLLLVVIELQPWKSSRPKKSNSLWDDSYSVQGGPLPVITGVITAISRLK